MCKGGGVSKFLCKYTLPTACAGESKAEDALPWLWGQVAFLPQGDTGWHWHLGLFAHKSIPRPYQHLVKLLVLLFCPGLMGCASQGECSNSFPLYFVAWQDRSELWILSLKPFEKEQQWDLEPEVVLVWCQPLPLPSIAWQHRG